jgi:hypothetical protein
VWVYSDMDSSYTVHQSSGFACALLESIEGFGADLGTGQVVSDDDWAEISGWETSGTGGRAGLFDLGGGFDAAAGRYSARVHGLYFAGASIMLGRGSPFARGMIALNGQLDTPRALPSASIKGRGGMVISGIVSLQPTEYISLWLKGEWVEATTQTGFSAALVSTPTLGPALRQLQLYGYKGAPFTVQHYGYITVRTDEGDVHFDEVANMAIAVDIGREGECPYSSVLDEDNGVPSSNPNWDGPGVPVGNVRISVLANSTQGTYELRAPIDSVVLTTDRAGVVFPAGAALLPKDGGVLEATAAALAGAIGNTGMVQSTVVATARGNVSVMLHAKGYQKCLHDCSGRGRCYDDGSCLCWFGYKGADCSVRECPNDCSGRGVCDQWMGTCTCDNRWLGDDCSEVACPAMQAGGLEAIAVGKICLECPAATHTCEVCAKDEAGVCAYGTSAPSMTSVSTVTLLLNATWTGQSPDDMRRRAQACQDGSPMCGYWARGGECRTDPDYMKAMCPVACEECPPPVGFSLDLITDLAAALRVPARLVGILGGPQVCQQGIAVPMWPYLILMLALYDR